MEQFFGAILISFSLAIFISPLIIKLIKRLNFKQNIYEYVKNHKTKQGTPTMGGIIFLVAITTTALIMFNGNFKLGVLCLTAFVAFGFLGFLDDFIKIKCNRNLGLKAYQKIIGQVAISVILCVYCYVSDIIPKQIFLPFSAQTINLGWVYIPLMVLVLLATTNSVNLTDGLDGLAGSTSFVFIVSFSVCLILYITNFKSLNLPYNIQLEWKNLLIICGAGAGAILAYLIHNSYPALIFMGDTGSLALGGLIGTITIVTGQVLVLPILGVCFVISSLSVIMQVLYYKLTKKRIFKMAPFHHHLQLKGMHESKIVSIYIVISIIIGVLGILLTSIFVV